MKLKVPFFKALKKWRGTGRCGPIALCSILKYYKIKFDLIDVAEKSGTNLKGATGPMGLAYYCLSKNMGVFFVREKKSFNDNSKDFSSRLRKFFATFGNKKIDAEFSAKCNKFSNYSFIQKKPSLVLLKKFLEEGKPVLIYFNVAVILKVNKLAPHYVVVTGFDKKNIFVHNIFPKNNAFQKIPVKTFLAAWYSDGLPREMVIPFK